MSSETRLIRPYKGGQEFQHILDTCRLRCADGLVEGGGELHVSLDDFLNFPFELRVDDFDSELVERGCDALRLPPDAVDLIAFCVAPRLRLVDIVFQRDLSDLSDFPRRLAVDSRQRLRAFRAPHGGADLRIYFCLNRSLPQRALYPWRKGTWLGRQEFSIRSDLSGVGFVPIRMTPEDRDHFGIPKDVTRYVTLDDHDPFDCQPAADVVKLFVDGELLDRLAVAAATPVGKHIQRQLFLDATVSIVFAVQTRLQEDSSLRTQHVDDFAGSVMHKLTEIVAGKGVDAATRDLRQMEFRRMCDSPTAFIARVEARTGLREDLLASFGDIG